MLRHRFVAAFEMLSLKRNSEGHQILAEISIDHHTEYFSLLQSKARGSLPTKRLTATRRNRVLPFPLNNSARLRLDFNSSKQLMCCK